jgi:hypothetical protein
MKDGKTLSKQQGSIALIEALTGMLIALVILGAYVKFKSSVQQADARDRCLVEQAEANLADPALDPDTVCP